MGIAVSVKIVLVVVLLLGALPILAGAVWGVRSMFQIGTNSYQSLDSGRRQALWAAIAVPVPTIGVGVAVGMVALPTGEIVTSAFAGGAVGVALMLLN